MGRLLLILAGWFSANSFEAANQPKPRAEQHNIARREVAHEPIRPQCLLRTFTMLSQSKTDCWLLQFNLVLFYVTEFIQIQQSLTKQFQARHWLRPLKPPILQILHSPGSLCI